MLQKIKKQLLIFSLALLFTAPIISQLSTTSAAPQTEPVNIYLFWGDGCPHCAKLKNYLKTIIPSYGDQIVLKDYEIWNNSENANQLRKVAEKLNTEASGVPFTVIGDKYFVGYSSDNISGQELKQRIDYCLKNSCPDSLKSLLGTTNNKTQTPTPEPSVTPQQQNHDNSQKIQVPFLGEINLSNLSLPLATIIIALMDGFNPCAMWILIFLISMLVGLQNRKRLYILGSIFIGTSALVYFLFLNAWFSVFQFVGVVSWIKIAVGIIAIVSGVIHLRNGLKSKGECHVTDDEKRASIREKIKKIVSENSYWLAIIGIVALAASVNLIELVCSAGLPAVYTALLASSNLPWTLSMLYMLLYIFIFMLDDLIVFFVAVKTLEVTGITSKYVKVSNIVGGILIIIIGLLLIFKPDILFFG